MKLFKYALIILASLSAFSCTDEVMSENEPIVNPPPPPKP